MTFARLNNGMIKQIQSSKNLIMKKLKQVNITGNMDKGYMPVKLSITF